MIEVVWCGFQRGVDQAAARAAVFCGLPTIGWMPLGYLTEYGPRPDFADLYGAKETSTTSYAARTRMNARDSQGTAWLGPIGSRGFIATERACKDLGRPFLVVPEGITAGARLIDWVAAERIAAINIAGSRESKCPGIGEKTERFLTEVFQRITSKVAQPGDEIGAKLPPDIRRMVEASWKQHEEAYRHLADK